MGYSINCSSCNICESEIVMPMEREKQAEKELLAQQSVTL